MKILKFQSFGEGIFEGCNSLKTIYVPDGTRKKDFKEKLFATFIVSFKKEGQAGFYWVYYHKWIQKKKNTKKITGYPIVKKR